MFNTLIGWVTRRKIIFFVLSFALILPLGFTTSLKAGPKTDKKGKNKPGKSARLPNDRGDKGEWITLNSQTTFRDPVVASHVHLLPNGKLLAWGPNLGGNNTQTIYQIWDPDPNCTSLCFQQDSLSSDFENLYCSGHSFLPDGKLVITGGTPLVPPTPGSPYQSGIDKAAIYDYASGTWGSWTPLSVMNGRRWYPTNITMPNGSILVWGGFNLDSAPNDVPQILEKQADGTFTWRNLNFKNPDSDFRYYTWLNMLSSGKPLVTVGIQAKSYLLTVGESFRYPKDFLYQYPLHPTNSTYDGALTVSHHSGSTIVFGKDQILAIGGGELPTNIVEKLDLNNSNPQWQPIVSLGTARRHPNSTVLPDGKVLVTGGNKGNSFNNSCPENSVKEAEMWDPEYPATWKLLAAATERRIYHSSAVLLPDGRIFTGGTTRNYTPNGVDGTDANGNPCPGLTQDNFTIEIFSPPYLFNSDGTEATRPIINNAPAQASYGGTMNFTVTGAGEGSRVTLVRLPSVTHSFNQNQGFVKLQPTITPILGQPNKFSYSVPITANRNELVPGHYMLFVSKLLDVQSNKYVPSKAAIIQVL